MSQNLIALNVLCLRLTKTHQDSVTVIDITKTENLRSSVESVLISFIRSRQTFGPSWRLNLLIHHRIRKNVIS